MDLKCYLKTLITLEKMTFNNNFIITWGMFYSFCGKSFAQDIFNALNILIYMTQWLKLFKIVMISIQQAHCILIS